MIRNIGLDIGNITTVYCSNKKVGIIESRLKEATEINKLSGANVLKTNDKEYLVSEGYFENNTFKYRKENFIKLLSYALADSVPDNSNINLCIGIPVQQFKADLKKELASIIRANKEIDIKINNKRKRVLIDKILIRPESYGVFKLFEAENKIIKNVPSVVIDIGGGTTDISDYLSNGKFHEGTSINDGLLKFYDSVKENIFTETGNILSIEETKEYTRGNFNLIGLKSDLHHLPTKTFFNDIYNKVVAKYPDITKYNVILCGGGADVVAEYFKKEIPHILIDSDITTNAKTFFQIAEQEF